MSLHFLKSWARNTGLALGGFLTVGLYIFVLKVLFALGVWGALGGIAMVAAGVGGVMAAVETYS